MLISCKQFLVMMLQYNLTNKCDKRSNCAMNAINDHNVFCSCYMLFWLLFDVVKLCYQLPIFLEVPVNT